MPGRTGYSARTAAFCFTLFGAIGVLMPFYPLWLAGRGFSDSAIAAIVAAPLLMRALLSPALAGAADRLPSLGAACVLYSLVAVVLFSGVSHIAGFWPTLLLSTGALVFLNTQVPLADAIILSGVRSHGIDYARTRLWGSVGFVAASLAGAEILRRNSVDAVYWMILGSFALTGAVAAALPRVARMIATTAPGFRYAFADPALRNALLAGGLVIGSHGAYQTFSSIYWRQLGFGEATIGALWGFSVVVEVSLFWLARHLPGWGARHFLLLGGAGALVRWLLFPLADVPVSAFPLQMLHAASFAANHLGVMTAIGAVSTPGHTARLQAAHQLVSGLLLAGATFASGPLFRISADAAFWTMAAMAAAGLFFASRAGRPQPQSSGEGGSTTAPE
jgi:PPP family 3-phenylpropionic acid transporter